jgi:hypothetical protein
VLRECRVLDYFPQNASTLPPPAATLIFSISISCCSSRTLSLALSAAASYTYCVFLRLRAVAHRLSSDESESDDEDSDEVELLCGMLWACASRESVIAGGAGRFGGCGSGEGRKDGELAFCASEDYTSISSIVEKLSEFKHTSILRNIHHTSLPRRLITHCTHPTTGHNKPRRSHSHLLFNNPTPKPRIQVRPRP